MEIPRNFFDIKGEMYTMNFAFYDLFYYILILIHVKGQIFKMMQISVGFLKKKNKICCHLGIWTVVPPFAVWRPYAKDHMGALKLGGRVRGD